MCQRWFVKFHVDNTILKDEEHSDQSTVADDDKIKRIISGTIAESCRNIPFITYNRHRALHNLGYVNYFDIWTSFV